ncbi:MAG: redox-sensing transcriptional repressor Rex [Chitinivibrionia bacterium]|nr:redox-sensing transcriptional repressor Rex [Chitinivibrionia bacterium]
MIPKAATERLSVMYTLLGQILENGTDDAKLISSKRIGKLLGILTHTVRKDLSFLGGAGSPGKRFSTKELKDVIAEKLGLAKRKAAVIGLGKIGTTIMEYDKFSSSEIEIVAGFDSDINRIDTIKTKIPLFPSREIGEIVKQKGIEIAFLTSSPESAKVCFERLEAGGIKAILNFTPIILESEKIHIRNIDFILESTILSAMIGLDNLEKKSIANNKK